MSRRTRSVSSQQAAATTHWADTIDWTARCDWLQVASFRIILYTHNTMLMRAERLVQVLQVTCGISCKFYRTCDRGFISAHLCQQQHQWYQCITAVSLAETTIERDETLHNNTRH